MQKIDHKITVLMPAYNAAKYIKNAIYSVLEQSFTDFELLIINDGSTDHTEKIIRGFNDPRIVLFSQSNQGIAAALNTGLSLAKTSLVARFDADDICYPARLQEQYDFITANPAYSIIGCDADYYDSNDNYVFTYSPPAHSNEDIQQLTYMQCPFIHSGVLYKKEAVLAAGGYNIHAHAFEDHLLWINMLKQVKAVNLPKTLIKVTLHPGSTTIDERWRRKRFGQIKSLALQSGGIGEKEGNELLLLLRQPNSGQLKQGSYHALLAKKYLWDNHQPRKARQNIRKALFFRPADIKSYGLWLLSFFPKRTILKIYHSARPSK